MRALRTLCTGLALVLAAAACADTTTQPHQPAPEPTAAAGADLAQAAVAALTAERTGPFHVVIPDDTRTESAAIVLHYHDGLVDRWRFVRGETGWTAAERLDRAADAATPADGPQLNRGTWGTSPPHGTPALGKIAVSYTDGTWPEEWSLYPVRYSGGYTYRWTASAEVVSGLEESIKVIRSAAFLTNGIVRWSVGDSIFSVDAYRKWTFGEWGTGVLKQECYFTGVPVTTPCYPNGTYRTGWTDAHYHITVERARATTLTLSSTSVQAQVGVSYGMVATVKDQYGNVMNAPVTWSTSNPAVATVTSSGVVTVHALGDAVITATSGTLSASATFFSRATVSISGATSVYEAWSTVTANVSPSGSYHYTWSFDRCHFRETERKCELAKPLTSGQDVSTASVYISKYDDFVRYRVTVRQYAGGPSMGSAELKVYGAGIQFGTGSPCGGLRVCP
jgi:Bacterial Ig-like domain (group 2)